MDYTKIPIRQIRATNDELGFKRKTILGTGTARFIGSNLVKCLYADVGDATVIGIDNMNDYYDVRLKKAGRGKKTITSNVQKCGCDDGWETDGERNDVKKESLWNPAHCSSCGHSAPYITGFSRDCETQ